MTNADLLEETYATALGAEGSAEKELENYQQGIQYSIDVFKASWEELSNTILGSDFLKTIVDFGSGAIQVVNDLASSLGGIGTVVTAIGGVALIKNFSSITSMIGSLGSAMSGLMFTGIQSEAIGLTGTLAAFATSLAGIIGVAAAVGVAIKGIYDYFNAFDDAIDKAVSSLAEFNDAQDELDSLSSQVDDITTQLESMAGEYNIDISDLDTEADTYVDDIIDKIESADTLKITDESTLEDLRAQNTELERQIALQEQVVSTAQQTAYEDAKKAVEMQATSDLTQQNTTYDVNGVATVTPARTDVITATQHEIAEIENLKKAREDYAEQAKTASEDEIEDINKTIESYDNQIAMYEEAVSSQLESLGEIKDAFKDVDDKEAQSIYKQITDLENSFANIDLSPLQKGLSSLDNYFSTAGMDNIKNAILDAVAAGETASDVFERMGLSLDSIGDGVDASTFNDYFNSLIAEAEEAQNAINSVEGTVESMQAAADTANQNSNWESAASLLADAKELYEQGLVGTDDFKTAAQYLMPDVINPDAKGFEYDADAYVAAWEKAQDKINRYFDSENPGQSMINAADDLVTAGLATLSDGEYVWTDNFKNSAEAAEAFGLSLSATEDILHSMEAYGAEFDQVFFSGEGLSEYETYLNSLKSTYDSMAEGDTKNKLGSLIEGFDEDYEKYQLDISNLDQDAIVHIKFEYDLASIASEIENYRAQIAAGDTSAETTSQMYVQQERYIQTAGEAAGLNVEGVEIPAIVKIEEEKSNIQQQIQEASKNGKDTYDLRMQLSNLDDVEANILDSFNNSEYAINVDENTTASEVQSAWDSAMSNMDVMDLVANLDVDDKEAIATLSSITQYDGKTIREAIALNDSDAINKFVDVRSMDGSVIHFDAEGDVSDVRNEIDELENQNTLIFTADVDGVETAVAAVKDEEGEITYVVDPDTNFQSVKDELASITNTEASDIKLRASVDTEQLISDLSGVDSTISVEVDATDAYGAIAEISAALSDIPEEEMVDLTANNNASESIIAVISELSGIPESKLTEINAADGASGVIQAAISNMSGLSTEETVGLFAEDNASGTINGVDAAINAMNLSPNAVLSATDGASSIISSVSSQLSSLNGKTANTYVYTHNITTNSSQANGTAHANGTVVSPHLSGRAKAKGDVDQWETWIDNKWRTKKPETALTGELGRELVVDLNNNRWYTVGDNGAEFTNIPAGAVVFNHQQTEELLKTGSTNGIAHAQGTAYANGWRVSSGTTSSSKSSSSSSSSSKSSSSSSSSSKKSSSSSSSKKSSSKSSSSSASSAIDELFDFIEIYLNRASRVTQLAIDAIDDAVSLSDKLSKNSTALTKIQSEITKNQQAADAYLAQANSVGLSSSYVTKIQNGSLDVSTITSQDTLDKINEYQEYYEKYLDCLDEAVSLQRELNDLAQERLDYIEESYDLVTKVHESLQQVNQSALDYNEAMGYSAISDSVKKAIQSSIDEAEEIYKVAQEELSQYQSEFNSLVKNGYIKEGSDAYNEATAKINELTAAVDDAAVAVIDFQDQLRQIDYTKLQNVIDGLDRVTSKLDAWIDLQEARDETIDESVYQQMLDYNNEQIANNMSLRSQYLKEQALYDVNSTKYQELADTIEKLDEETLKLMQDNEELKDSIFELRFSALEEAIDGYEDLRDEISDFYKLLNEDSFFDKNGSITSNGLAGISLIAEQIGIAKQEVADYTEGMNKLKESFDNGVISEVEYNEKMEEYRKGLQGAILDIKDLTDEISDLYVTQVKKEIDALKEVINKRKEALQAKADYYEYDKKISSQTKDINSLQAQIAALEGANSASAQAQLKNLQAQLAEAQEELEDTKYQHSVDIQVAGYDSMSDELDDFLDDLEYSMSQSMETQLEIVESYLDKIVASYEDAYGVINDIVTSTGWIGSEGFTSSQSSLSTSSGASSIVSSATSSQSDVSSSSAASGTVTSAIDNNDSKNAEYESQIMTEEDTSNRQVAELTVSPSSVSVVAGKSTSISTSIRPTDAANQKLSWSSSNTSVATVSSSGKITGVKAGSCKVTVSTTDGSGISKTVSVTVTAPATTTSTTTTTTSSTKTTTSQGNGIPEVGDKVTFNSGRYYYDSYGSSPSGSKYQGKTVYITKVHNDSRPKPIHISTGSKLGSGDLGWLTKSQISGYAKGTKFVPDDQWSQINEQGREILVTNSGQILSYLQRGDAVIPNELTENLYDWGAMNPSEFLKNGNGEAPVVSSVGEVNKSVDVVFNYDNLVNIEGKADANTVDELRKAIPKLGKELTDVVTGNLTREGRKLGLR